MTYTMTLFYSLTAFNIEEAANISVLEIPSGLRQSLLSSWIFIGRTDTEAEAPIHWPPDVKSCLTGKEPDAGKEWGQEEKGMTEDVMVGWHHWLNGHESEQMPEDGEGEGSLACCSPWGRKESNTTERLNKTKARHSMHFPWGLG